MLCWVINTFTFFTFFTLNFQALGFTFDNKNLHNISLGQGQEIVAENAMDIAAREGHWVILQVINE